MDEQGGVPEEVDGREGLSRRGFLVGAAGLTGVALSGVWKGSPARAAEGGAPQAAAAAAGDPGGYRFLELDGQIVGTVQKVSGGTAVGIVEDDPPGGAVGKKHIAGIKYNEFNLEIGFSMGKPIYDWIKSSFDRKVTRKDGAIIACDFDRNVKSYREFHQALITEVTIPACDGASKDPGFMTVKFAPESTARKPPSGGVQAKPSNQKTWLPSNFRISIGDLPTARVSKIDSFTIKQNVTTTPDGHLEPTSLEFPNIKIYLPESEPWYAWHEDFVINGNNGDDQEITGNLDFLSLDHSKVLARWGFDHLGILGLMPTLPEPNDTAIRKLQVEMYCEGLHFDIRPSF